MQRARCFACSGEMLPEAVGFICPQRYLSPHTEDFMFLVGDKLVDLGVRKTEDITPQLHTKAIEQARKDWPLHTFRLKAHRQLA